MSRTAFEDALWTWVQAASGYGADNVIWRDGKWNRPSGPYVELRLGPLLQIGQDWSVVEASPEATPVEGEEFIAYARGFRTTELQLEAFNGQAGAAHGVAAPDEVLARVMTRARLPSIRDALSAGGVGIARFGPVQTIDGVLGNSSFEARALLTVFLHLSAEEQEFATYIQSVALQRVNTAGVPLGDEFVVEE